MRDYSVPTERQWEVLRFVHEHIAAHGFAPSYREIIAAVGLRSRSTNVVRDHLVALARKGYVAWEPGRTRTLRVLRTEGLPRLPDAMPSPSPVRTSASGAEFVFVPPDRDRFGRAFFPRGTPDEIAALDRRKEKEARAGRDASLLGRAD